MGTSGPAEAYRPPVTPFAGWTRDSRGRLVPLESAPHVGGFAPPGTGKTRRWLAQSAVLWPGPAFVSSSKDDLMQMVASRRAGPIALLDLRPITAPFYPNDFVAYRFDPTALISTSGRGEGDSSKSAEHVGGCAVGQRVSQRRRSWPVGSVGLCPADMSAVRGEPGGHRAGDGLDAGGLGEP